MNMNMNNQGQHTEPPVVNSFMVTPLRISIRIFHICSGILGTILCLYATTLFVRYHRTGLVPPDDPHPITTTPWSILILASFGGLLCVSGMIGYRGAHNVDKRNTLFIGMIVLSIMMCLQGLLMTCIFVDAAWKQHLPDDPSGFWTLFSEWIVAHEKMAKIACIGLLCTESMALAWMMWLYSIYQSAYEEWLFDVEDQQERARRMFGEAAEHAYDAGVSSGWSNRAKSKYGMESGQLREETRAVRDIVTPLLPS